MKTAFVVFVIAFLAVKLLTMPKGNNIEFARLSEGYEGKRSNHDNLCR